MTISIQYLLAILLIMKFGLSTSLRIFTSRNNINEYLNKRGVRSRFIETLGTSGKDTYTSTTTSTSTSTTRLNAKKVADNESNPETSANWATIKYGTEQDAKNSEMDDRLRDAERWVSRKLSDKESSDLNRQMGIEAEVIAAMAAEEDEKNGIKKNKKEQNKLIDRKLLESRFSTKETKNADSVKGFLELNPYICSGCGTPFQSKNMENPGFLPKDKIQDHLKKAEKIKEKQAAIKILEMAGIEVCISCCIVLF